MSNQGKCPVMHGANTASAAGSTANQRWWPEQLNLKILNQNCANVNPAGGSFNYASAFKSLDLGAVKKDLTALMTDSQDCLLYTSPSPRDQRGSRMPSSA